jgi:hypothetical protein
VLRGFRPAVTQVTVTGPASADGHVRVELLDGWPECDVVPADDPGGPALRTEAGRAGGGVAMVLVEGPSGWRIGSAGRLA